MSITMGPFLDIKYAEPAGSSTNEEGLVAKDAVAAAVLMEQLEQPAAEKEREAAEKAKRQRKRQWERRQEELRFLQ